MEVLRIATAGSVDDGKTTLIGRLLYASRALLAEQRAAARAATERRGGRGLDLALLTDGLRAELGIPAGAPLVGGRRVGEDSEGYGVLLVRRT